jgi:chemotaxis protein MotB
MLKALERVKELEAIAARRKAVFEQIRASLQAMASAGKLKVVMKRGMLVVQMPEAILFDTGKADLKPEGVAAIQEMTAALLTIPDRRFQLSGHTDDRGSEETNWKLSLARAMSVLRVMRSAGMPPQRSSVAGYAWFQPDAPNDTEEGRAQNRRFELVLVPNLEELQLPE